MDRDHTCTHTYIHTPHTTERRINLVSLIHITFATRNNKTADVARSSYFLFRGMSSACHVSSPPRIVPERHTHTYTQKMTRPRLVIALRRGDASPVQCPVQSKPNGNRIRKEILRDAWKFSNIRGMITQAFGMRLKKKDTSLSFLPYLCYIIYSSFIVRRAKFVVVPGAASLWTRVRDTLRPYRSNTRIWRTGLRVYIEKHTPTQTYIRTRVRRGMTSSRREKKSAQRDDKFRGEKKNRRIHMIYDM